uniref:Uncharacterized protein n=1 Tax=Anguilla anguilla TaxID=7936 RepID=A0A0E9U7F7_ANGAN
MHSCGVGLAGKYRDAHPPLQGR